MINAKELHDEWESMYPHRRSNDNRAKFEDLLGKTIVELDGAEKGSEHIAFLCDDGSRYLMYHEQDCCESVEIEDVWGDISCLLNTPITKAKECVSDSEMTDWGSCTYTFYDIATIVGYVTIRWFGESNGYYSESVDFVKL